MGSKNTQNVLASVILGAAVGILAGVLIAPDKGRNTRKKIKDKADSFGGDLKNTYSKYKDELKDEYDKYKQEFKKKKDEVIDHLSSEYDDLTKK